MRSFISLFVLFFLFISIPSDAGFVVGSGVSSCADCSGTASFIWECNSTTVGDTGFSPYGCSDGDSGAATNDNAAISSGNAVFNDTGADGQDYFYFDVSSDDIADDTVGTVFIKFKVDTWVDSVILWQLYADATDIAYIRLTTSDDLQGSHYGQTHGSGAQYVALYGNHVTDDGTYFIVRYRWQTGVAGDDHQITLYTAAGSELEDNPDDDDLVAFSDQAGNDGLRIGNPTAQASSNVTIEYAHVYKEWRNDDDGY